MIAKIYKLPAGLTSPDDKPDYQLGQQLTSNNAYYSTIDANTISAPDLDTITVQTGALGDLETQQLYLSNFINVGTFGYQITNIVYVQQTAKGVYEVEGKLDIYFSFLVSFFDETSTNINRVYFHQKHLNRSITGITIDDTTKIQTIQNYLGPEPQQYLLNRHPALKDIGKQQVKTYHILNIANYNPVNASDLGTLTTSGTTTVKGGAVNNNQNEDFTVSLSTAGFTNVDGGYSPYNYFNASVGSCAYPVIVFKADVNSNNSTVGGLFPYFLCDGGQNWLSYGQATLTVSLTNNPHNFSPYTTTILYPTAVSNNFKKLFDIASDYYSGMYLFPLPCYYLKPNGLRPTNSNTPEWVPISDVLNQGLFVNGNAYEPIISGTTDASYGSQAWVSTVGENIANQIQNGSLCNLVCRYINGNTFYAETNLTPINNNYIDMNYSVIEPALLNWMGFNVRLYGQDNLVRPLDFNYTTSTITTDLTNGLTTPTVCEVMDALYCYLNYFAITISPPNVMITNIPYHDLGTNVLNSDVPEGVPKFGAVNGYNDVVFPAMMKSEVPTPSTAGTNYIANAKNSYDMGLNISNLLAQNAQAEVQIAKNNMGSAITNEISGLGGAIGDIFTGNGGALGSAIGGLATGGISIANAVINANTIAPNNADIQEMKYNYMASGKQQDMSRTTSMRVSATATTNTLNDTVYTIITEVPPLYEQVYIINYYALHGYIVNKWDMGKYGFNRKLCNFVCCSFFTNAMLPNLNINGKTKIDALLNQGFRVGCYNSNQQVQISPTDTATIDGNTIPYNYVLYNSFTNGDYIYNNVEVSETNGTAEIYYLNNGQEATNDDVQAGVSNFSNAKDNKSNEIVQPRKNCAQK